MVTQICESRYTNEAAEGLARIIIDKSSNIFQWAALVVDMVSECINNHETSASIREMMSEVPPELGNVYQHIIENVIKERNKPKTLLLFQLVCLPK
jgi:hypothetical protein